MPLRSGLRFLAGLVVALLFGAEFGFFVSTDPTGVLPLLIAFGSAVLLGVPLGIAFAWRRLDVKTTTLVVVGSLFCAICLSVVLAVGAIAVSLSLDLIGLELGTVPWIVERIVVVALFGASLVIASRAVVNEDRTLGDGDPVDRN